jgi:hypothetical protein
MIVVAALVLLGACRGEPVPRDYQNAPPDIGKSPQTQSDTPSQGATGDAPPQPSTGNEGTAGPYEPMTTEGATTTTMADTPPTTTT